MKTKNKRSNWDKTPSKVPFKRVLFNHNTSWDLLLEVKNKTYSDFVKDCKDPELLEEVMIIQNKDSGFSSLKKINKIIRNAAFAAAIAAIFRSQKLQNRIKCWMYRNFLLKSKGGGDV